jgi:hypothetical protein
VDTAVDGGLFLKGRSNIDSICVDSCPTILGGDPMTDLVLENFAAFGSDT